MRHGRLLGLCIAIPACSIPPFSGTDGTGTCVPRSQHDEDHDMIPDDCDLCPHIAAAQTDTDHDGIGDDCDLDPAHSGQVVKFYTFETGMSDLIADGGVAQSVPDTIDVGGPGQSFLFVPDIFTSVRIEIGFEILSSNTGGAEMGVYTSHPASSDPETEDGDNCYIGLESPTTTFVQDWEDEDDRIGGSVDAAYSTGLVGHIRVDHINDGFECTLDQLPLGIPGSSVIMTPKPSKPAGRVGFKAMGSMVRLTYIYVVGQP